jgi:hypothetical protein
MSVIRTGIIYRVIYRVIDGMPVGWIINRGCTNINRISIIRWKIVYRCIINRAIIITYGKVNTRFKIPFIIRIKIKTTRLIVPIYINLTVDHDIILINFLLRWLSLVTIIVVHRLHPCQPKPGIATRQGKEQ